MKFYLKSIQTKILLGIILILTVVIALITGISVYLNQSFIIQQAEKQIKEDLNGMTLLLENYKQQSIAHATSLAANPEIIEGAKNRDFNYLLKVTAPLMRDAQLDYIVITDPKGLVIIRTHEPDKIPAPDDSIANQVNIVQALAGKPFVGIEEGKVVKLSVRGGAPIRDTSGKLIGAISAGYTISQNKIVDNAKNIFGSEFSLFLGKENVANTLVSPDNKRFLDSTAYDQTVLESVLSSGEMVIKQETLQNTKYISGYAPVIGANGKITSIIAATVPTKSINNMSFEMLWKIIVPATGIFILVVILGFIIAKKINIMIKSMQTLMFKAGIGDLTVQAKVDSIDELGELNSSFNLMLSRQNDIINKIRLNSGEIASVSEEIAATSEQVTSSVADISASIQELSQNAEHCNNSVLESSKAFDELSALIKEAKASAESAGETSQITMNAALEGKITINEAVGCMTNINENTVDTENLIATLSDYSQQIGLISETINNIADQTNLLALNAAIEAARAGEAGRGFAVVAEEVRKLAEQSNKGANEVSILVNKVLDSTSAVVSATRESRLSVEQGVVSVNKAGQALENILSAVKETVDNISKISNITGEETSSSEKIIHLIGSVASVIDRTLSNSQEVAASVEEVTAAMESVAASTQHSSSMATEFTDLVDVFKISTSANLTDIELLEKAKADHLLWKMRISNMIDGYEKIGPEEVASHHDCRFGKWYYQELNHIKKDKTFIKLEAPHNKVHKCAYEAVKAYKDGDIKKARKNLREIEHNSIYIITMLNKLIKKVRTENNKKSIIK